MNNCCIEYMKTMSPLSEEKIEQRVCKCQQAVWVKYQDGRVIQFIPTQKYSESQPSDFEPLQKLVRPDYT
jgi:hypothetical protein